MNADVVARLNALPEAELQRELEHCCGSRRWLAEVAQQRPFADGAALLDAAAAAWRTLEERDWSEALNGAALSIAGADGADNGTLTALDVALGLYRDRFGWNFVTEDIGLGADELLMLIRIRLGHDDAAELRRSRAEQMRLTERLLGDLLRT
jgi:2-oxo-4-hydroxy-4-carboxy-5-ureidoimidazoline decarboxylase